MKNSNEVVATIPTTQQPYADYYGGRNGGVARRLADTLGRRYLGNIPQDHSLLARALADGHYTVLAKPIALSLVNEQQLTTAESIYGGAFVDPRLVDKTSLHPGVDSKPVYDDINAVFLEEVSDLVIPGYSITSPEQIEVAIALLRKQGIYNLRLKDASASDGQGQFVVHSAAEAIHAYKSNGMTAAVIEENLETLSGEPLLNISVGYIALPGLGKFTVLSKQRDLPAQNGTIMYGGAECVLLKGDPGEVVPSAEIAGSLGLSSADLLDATVANAALFLQSFTSRNECLVSRITVDTLRSRICDISCRVTGADPFIQLALQEMLKNPALDSVCGFVHLNYTTENFEPEADGQANYLNYHSPGAPGDSLQIVAGVKQFTF